MTTENDILPFCTTTVGGNLLTQAAYAAATDLPIGNQPGIASSALVNKVLRQSSLMAAALATCIVNLTGQPVVDSDGALSTVVTNLTAAFAAAAADAILPCGTATGTASAIVLTPTTPLGAYKAGQPFSFVAASNNPSGGTTVNISGLGAITFTKGSGQALSANDVEASNMYVGILTSTSNATLINKPAFAHGADVASASTMVLNGTGGDIVNITGTATVAAVTLNEGKVKITKFASTGAVLTYGSSLLLNTGGTNYTVQANDVVTFVGLASGVVYGTIIPANGLSPAVSTPTYAANTVVANATTSTAAATGIALALNNLIGRGSSGNIAAITLAGNLSLVGTVLTGTQKLKSQEITASGNFSTSANITTSTPFNFRLVAGGAGGAGCASATAGSSGGAGETVDWLGVTGLSPSSNYTVTIGGGGTGGASGANNQGNAGGNTSIVIGSDTVTATGAPATPSASFLGGLGGTNSHSSPSVGTLTAIPGGGGAGGIGANYSNATGPGGSSSQGGGGAAAFQSNGIAGGAFGSGASGGNGQNASGAFAGATGKGGILIATWAE